MLRLNISLYLNFQIRYFQNLKNGNHQKEVCNPRRWSLWQNLSFDRLCWRPVPRKLFTSTFTWKVCDRHWSRWEAGKVLWKKNSVTQFWQTMTLIISMFQRKLTKRQLNFRHRISEIITLGIFTLYLSNVAEVPNQHNMASIPKTKQTI